MDVWAGWTWSPRAFLGAMCPLVLHAATEELVQQTYKDVKMW